MGGKIQGGNLGTSHNGFRRREPINMRVEPAGYGRRRGHSGIWLFLIVSVCLIFLVVNLLSPRNSTPSALVTITPAVTVQVIGRTTYPEGVAGGGVAGTSASVAVNDSLPAEAMPAAPDADSAQISVGVDTAFVNVRSGPGLGYVQLGMLAAGQTAPVTGRSSDGQWWQISFAGRRGWVFAQVVAFSGDESAVSTVSVQADQ
jgi:uncharacterized protein YgiM (DUF1202 family)